MAKSKPPPQDSAEDSAEQNGAASVRPSSAPSQPPSPKKKKKKSAAEVQKELSEIGRSTEEKPPVNILPEHQPRDAHGGEPFEVQEERRRRRIRPNQPKHEQQGSNHATK